MRVARLVGRIALATVVIVIGAWAALLVYGRDAPTQPAAAVSAADSVPVPREFRPGLLAVPVAGVARQALRDNWGDPRDNGQRLHHGTDIMAPSGTLVTAAAPGTIEKLWQSAAGGTTLYVRSPARDWSYYYAHLSGYAPGIHEGQAVRAGDPLGYVGDTGNAGAGNFHLHFGMSRTTIDQHWYQGEDVDPFPYLSGKAGS